MEERPNCKVCGTKLTKKNNGKSITCCAECSKIYWNAKAKLERDNARKKAQQIVFKTFEEKPEYDEVFYLRDVFDSKQAEVLFKQSIFTALKYRFKTKLSITRSCFKNRRYTISVASINELIQLHNTYKQGYIKLPMITKRDFLYKYEKIIAGIIKKREANEEIK